MNKRKSTFRILFYLKRKVIKMDGTVPIMCRITVNGTITSFSCKLNVKPKQWNVKEGKTFGRNADDRLLNNQIKVIRKSICRHYEDIFNGIGPLTAERVKIAYLGLDRYNRTLLQVFENHNKEYEQLVKNGVREFSTYRKYCYVYKYLEEFLYYRYKLKDIALIDIRSCFIIDFELYLREKRRCSNNTVCIYIAPLKRMISIAQSNGWLDYNPFSSYHIPVQRKDREYLVMSEVEAIINVVFTRRKKLYEFIRDLFIFSVFTGVSYVDLVYLTKENLKKFDDGLWLCFKRHKTGVMCNIPLLKIPLDIITKYQNKNKTGALFPVATYSTLSTGLKTIAKMCGIKKHLTWHVGRHTFASEICLSNGVPIETISRILGHTDIKTTQIYAKISTTIIYRDMVNLSRRLEGLLK